MIDAMFCCLGGAWLSWTDGCSEMCHLFLELDLSLVLLLLLLDAFVRLLLSRRCYQNLRPFVHVSTP